jgi:hypothetical protein
MFLRNAAWKSIVQTDIAAENAFQCCFLPAIDRAHAAVGGEAVPTVNSFFAGATSGRECRL